VPQQRAALPDGRVEHEGQERGEQALRGGRHQIARAVPDSSSCTWVADMAKCWGTYMLGLLRYEAAAGRSGAATDRRMLPWLSNRFRAGTSTSSIEQETRYGGRAPLAASTRTTCCADTVYRDDGAGLRPVAFIDWDLAAPGDRLHDVGQACWQCTGVARTSIRVVAGGRMRAVCERYRLTDRAEVLNVVLWWQDRTWRGIDAAADVDPAMARLRDTGVFRRHPGDLRVGA
jgi:hypothetical protein